MRRTKIVCTIGPASSSQRVLQQLIWAGMDVARLNFSHGTHEQHARVIAALRAESAARDSPIAILQDLSGPKVRLGKIACGTVTLRRGQTITLTCRDVPGDPHEISLPVPELIAALQPGDRLFADDGRVELRVLSVTDTDVVARAVVPGELSSHKGVMSPGVMLDIPAVTPRDITDLRFGLAQGVDWIAASYVRRPEDLAPLREVMREVGIHCPLIAKIEKLEAVRRLEEIIAAVDGVMVARGDLGVETPIDEVPLIQKRIIRLCNQAGKPVITATQMLDSMIHNPLPTRAEVTDVANAILDGTDAVMLSGETAVGKYPVETVRMMAKIACTTEPSLPDRPAFSNVQPSRRAEHIRNVFCGSASQRSAPSAIHPPDITEAVARATVEMARALKAAAILCATTSGNTARQIARFRPDVQVIGATPFMETYRRLALTWGVRPILIPNVTNTDQMIRETVTAVIQRRMVRTGDRVILTAGVPVNVPGTTNLIKVHVVGQPLDSMEE